MCLLVFLDSVNQPDASTTIYTRSHGIFILRLKLYKKTVLYVKLCCVFGSIV